MTKSNTVKYVVTEPITNLPLVEGVVHVYPVTAPLLGAITTLPQFSVLTKSLQKTASTYQGGVDIDFTVSFPDFPYLEEDMQEWLEFVKQELYRNYSEAIITMVSDGENARAEQIFVKSNAGRNLDSLIYDVRDYDRKLGDDVTTVTIAVNHRPAVLDDSLRALTTIAEILLKQRGIKINKSGPDYIEDSRALDQEEADDH